MAVIVASAVELATHPHHMEVMESRCDVVFFVPFFLSSGAGNARELGTVRGVGCVGTW